MKKEELQNNLNQVKNYAKSAAAAIGRINMDGFFKQNRRYFAYAGLGLAVVFVLYLGYLYLVLTPKLANADLNTLLPISTQILDRNGKPLFEVDGKIRRTVIKSQDIPEAMKQATVVAEDKNFYSHIGIDPAGIGRAMIANFKAAALVQGGSTITQQLVKNLLLDSRKNLNRKLKEAILALMLESQSRKDEILTAYLNSVSYGSNLVGVNEAAQTMFGKNPAELTVEEAATLAALPRSPGYLSPYTGNKNALVARRNYILAEMKKRGEISDAAYQTASRAELTVRPYGRYRPATHFSLLVRDQLIAAYGREKVERGGLIVKTTLDSGLQADVEKLMARQRARINGWGASNAGAVVLDDKTGEVLAMVGSFDYNDEKIDGKVNITLSPRQPGSSFKPIVYSALFSGTNYNPGSIIYDVETRFGNYTPENYSRKHYGPLTVRRALAGSVNVAAVKAGAIAGINKILDTASSLGISTLTQRDRYGLALTLGAGEVKPVEMAAAFAAFGNGGQYNPARTILEITDHTGKVLYRPRPETRQALSPEVAYQISSILSDNEARSFIFGANSPLARGGRALAAKTGTTSNFKDAWTVGYTTSRAVAVWVGNNDGRLMRYGADGVFAAAPLWRAVMDRSMQGVTYEEFKPPSNMKLVNGEYLAEWQSPTAGAKLALNSEKPNNPAWEKPVQDYLKKQQEQAAQAPVLTPTGAGGGMPAQPGAQPDVGGAPDTETQPHKPPPSAPPSSDQPMAPNTAPTTTQASVP